MGKSIIKKNISKIVFILIIFGIFLFFGNSSNAAVKLDEWRTNVLIKGNGDILVQEKWKGMTSTKSITTLYRTFSKDFIADQNIVEPSVTYFKSDGTQVRYNRNNVVLEKEAPGYFHLGPYKGTLELAWGLPNGYTTDEYFIISYTIKNKIYKYTDYAELYYKFIDKSNEIEAKYFTMNVKAEKGLFNKENSLIFGHGQGDGEINFGQNGEIIAGLKGKKLLSGEMFEIRIAFPRDYVYVQSENLKNTAIKEELLSQEKRFQENTMRAKKRAEKKDEIYNKGLYVVAVIVGILSVISVKKACSERAEKEMTVKKFTYYPEIPESLGINIMKIFSFLGKNNVSEAVKIIMLKLLKYNVIKMVPGEKNLFGKQDYNYYLDEKAFADNRSKLNEEDVYIFSRIQSVIDKESKEIDGKEKSVSGKVLGKKLGEQWDKIAKEFESILKIEKNKNINEGLFSKEKSETKLTIGGAATVLTVITVIVSMIMGKSGILLLGIFVVNMICSCIVTSKEERGITTKGIQTKYEVEGLKRQLTDASMIKELTEQSIVKWEDFLIFATILGVSKKVLENLKVVAPELEESLMNTSPMFVGNAFAYNESMQGFSKAYDSKVSYSGDFSAGGGGGFSGGGGGGFGGGGGGGR